jgi:hypothetical protein
VDDDPVLTPMGWPYGDGVVAGFGDRFTSPSEDGVVRVRQVHGVAVVRADTLTRGEVNDVAADALVVTQGGVVAAVATADCVPILLLEPHARWGAAIHAGWRGTLAGVVAHTVEAARAYGLAPDRLLAAIGPAIGPCCYEVGDDVAASFEAAGLTVRRSSPMVKATLDLRDANRELLKRAGLFPSRIQVCGPCTRCRSDRFHSYRADGAAAGRQLSWVGWASRSP